MRALGAEVVRTPDAEGMQGAIRRAKELVAGDPTAFMAGQFENLANPDYHYETTAHEIFEQMNGKVDAVVLGCGTCGTFSGIARYLKEKSPRRAGLRGRNARFDAGGRAARSAQSGRDRHQLHPENF